MAKFDALNPFEPLNTPFRVRSAFECAAAAAYTLAVLNLITAWAISGRTRPFHSLLGSDPHSIWIVHLLFAAAAANLGLVIGRWKPGWACWTVFLWAVVECVGLTGPLYAHGAMFPLGPLIFAGALPGIRAVDARKRLAEQSDQMD